jgi:repressor LexA
MEVQGFGFRLKQLRKHLKLSQKDLADLTKSFQHLISKYESGKVAPGSAFLDNLAKSTNVSLDWLLKGEGKMLANHGVQEGIMELQILGTIAAGGLRQPDEEAQEKIQLPKFLLAEESRYPEDLFVLQISGDSMIGAGITPSSYVVISRRIEVQSGQIAAVQLDKETTLKRYFKIGDKVRLQAANPNYPDILLEENDLQYFKIIGKPVLLIRKDIF